MLLTSAIGSGYGRSSTALDRLLVKNPPMMPVFVIAACRDKAIAAGNGVHETTTVLCCSGSPL